MVEEINKSKQNINNKLNEKYYENKMVETNIDTEQKTLITGAVDVIPEANESYEDGEEDEEDDHDKVRDTVKSNSFSSKMKLFFKKHKYEILNIITYVFFIILWIISSIKFRKIDKFNIMSLQYQDKFFNNNFFQATDNNVSYSINLKCLNV